MTAATNDAAAVAGSGPARHRGGLPRVAAALRASGLFRRSPFAGEPYPAELGHVPMDKPHEYESVALFERPGAAPVLVSPGQRYRLLDEVVASLRTHVPGLGVVAVRLYGPDFNVQLPAGLLAEDVVLTHAPMRLLPTLAAGGARNVAVIDHDLRADGLERGANRFAMWLVAPTPEAADGFAALLDGPGPWQAMAGLRFEGLDAAALDRALREEDVA